MRSSWSRHSGAIRSAATAAASSHLSSLHGAASAAGTSCCWPACRLHLLHPGHAVLQPAMPRHAMHATPCKLCCIMPRSCQSVRPSCVQLMHTMHTLPGHGASWQDAAFTGTTLPAKPLAAFQPRGNTATPYRPSHAWSLHGCMQPCMGYMAWLPLCSSASTCWLQGRLRAGGQHHAHPGESERCPSWVCWLAASRVSATCWRHQMLADFAGHGHATVLPAHHREP